MATFGVIIVKHSQIMLVTVSRFGLPLDFYNGFTEISIFYLLRSCFTPWWLLLWLLGFPHFGTLIWKRANQIATTSHLSNTELARILFPPPPVPTHTPPHLPQSLFKQTQVTAVFVDGDDDDEYVK